MNKLLCSVALVGLLSVPVAAAAQVHISPHAAFAEDVDLGIGAAVAFPIEAIHENVEGMASFTLHFPGEDSGFGGGGFGSVDVGYWEVNALLRYLIPVEGSTVVPYVAAGLGLGNFSVDVEGFGGIDIPGAGTQIGLKAGGGARFPTGSLNPFAELYLGLGDIPTFELRGGVAFAVGG